MSSTSRSAPVIGERLFSSARGESRVRRAADVWTVGVASLLLLAVGLLSRRGNAVDDWAAERTPSLPGVVGSITTAVVLVAVGWTALVILVSINRGRSTLVRDQLMAAAISLVGAGLIGRIAFDEWPALLQSVFDDDGPDFPAVELSILVAVLTVSTLSYALPIRNIHRWLLVAVTIVIVLGGDATPTTAVGGLLVGYGAAASTRLLVGTSRGVPSLDRVRAATGDLGVEIDGLRFRSTDRTGELTAVGMGDGGPIEVRVFGRDAAEWTVASRVWRGLWYRDGESVSGVSRHRLAEHEALVALLAARAGLMCPSVRLVRGTPSGDVLLVSDLPTDMTLEDLDANEIDDDHLDAVWAALERLHDVGIAHGSIGTDRVMIRSVEGRPEAGLRTFRRAIVAADDDALGRDIAATITSLAVSVGAERAIASAARNLDAERLGFALPVLQRAALPHRLTSLAKSADLEIDQLRAAAATAFRLDEPDLVELRRVTLKDVLGVVLIAFVVYSVAGWVVTIDVGALRSELADANWTWIVVAFAFSQTTNVFEVTSLGALVSQPVPFGRTIRLQYAAAYLDLAVPSGAGQVAVTIRYLQKLGVPTGVAAGGGPFMNLVGLGTDIVLTLLTFGIARDQFDLSSDIDLSGARTVVLIALAAVAAAAVVVLRVPKLREIVVPAVKDFLAELRSLVSDRRRVVILAGSVITRRLLFPAALGSLLAAFGHPQPFLIVVFANTAVSVITSLVPVPGGIGVGEVGIVIAFTALGVPQGAALATAIVHRLFTVYLPAVYGFFALRSLTKAGYV